MTGKRRIPFKKLLSRGITNLEGVFLELPDGTKIRTSPVIGYSGCNGGHIIETNNSIYYSI